MEELLYKKIKSPLNKKRFVKDALYEYIFSDNLFNGLFKNKDKSNNQSLAFHDILFKEVYDDWKKKIDGINDGIKDNDLKSKEINTLYKFLNSFYVKNFKDVSLVLSEGNKKINNVFNKYCPISHDSDGFTVIDSTNKGKFDYGLCLNCDLSKLHLVVYKFYEKCKKNNLNYYIKFDESGQRKDSIIIKCTENNLNIYLKILEEIIKENDLDSYLNDLPLCVGEISDKIGYISGKDDFFTRRTSHIEKCIEQETINWMNKNLDVDVETVTGRYVPYKYFIFNRIAMEKKHKLLNDFLCELDVKDICSKKFINIIFDSLIKNYVDICNALFYNDYTYKLSIPYKNGKIEFSYNDFKNLLKEQADFFMNMPGFADAILDRIKNTSAKCEIDPSNYSLDIGDVYLLGKNMDFYKNRVTMDMINNFDGTNKKLKGSREGCILDGNMKNRFFNRMVKKRGIFK